MMRNSLLCSLRLLTQYSFYWHSWFGGNKLYSDVSSPVECFDALFCDIFLVVIVSLCTKFRTFPRFPVQSDSFCFHLPLTCRLSFVLSGTIMSVLFLRHDIYIIHTSSLTAVLPNLLQIFYRRAYGTSSISPLSIYLAWINATAEILWKETPAHFKWLSQARLECRKRPVVGLLYCSCVGRTWV